MKRLLTCALATSLALLGCATQTQQQTVSAVTHVETQTVKEAVPVLCVQSIPKPRAALSTAQQIYMSGSGYQVVMKFDREVTLRDSYEADLVAALKACLQPQTGSPGGSAAKK